MMTHTSSEGERLRRAMQHHTIYTSRYGMAVPASTERAFRLRSVTSLRWRNFSDAMARVVSGVRMDSDLESLLTSSSPGPLALRPAGDVSTCPAEGWVRNAQRQQRIDA